MSAYTVPVRRPSAILGTFVFLFVAPGVAAGLVPWWITHWRFGPPVLHTVATRYVGAALVLLGAGGVLDSFARFAIQGRGTPVPALPPVHLVVSGLYRNVRNPMYVAVTAAILGQALLFASRALLIYGVLVWLFFHLFVYFYEEPTLRAKFGAEYEAVCREVPRWIPRLRRAPSSFTAKQG